MIKDLWDKNAIIYCLHVGTFMDTNGDGVGDFAGLMWRLDYLAGLGITCIWLMPFQTSPRRDDGHDISDYYSVDPCYGTLGDFVELAQAARQRGIRVIIDRRTPTKEWSFPAYRRQHGPETPLPVNITFIAYDFQPDLNTQNPEVQEEIRKIMGFWLELGVSGFRMDAIPFVIQTKGADRRSIENYSMLRDMREFLQWRQATR